jgi:hypothetical protein
MPSTAENYMQVNKLPDVYLASLQEASEPIESMNKAMAHRVMPSNTNMTVRSQINLVD